MLLHATRQFIASQKGQVSINEESELQLISDTHWYWWFVRVLDSGAEGFVPAEFVELPGERLARLNRKINIRIFYEPEKPTGKVQKRLRKSVRFSDPLDMASDDIYDEAPVPISPTSSDEDELSSDAATISDINAHNKASVETDVIEDVSKTDSNRFHIQDSLDDLSELSERLIVQAL